MSNQNTNLQRTAAFYHSLGKVQTEINNLVGNELYKSAHNVRSSEVWMDSIPYSPITASASQFSDGIVVRQIGSSSVAPDNLNIFSEPAYLYPLAQSNYQTWFIDSGTPSASVDGFVPSSEWVKPLINPSDVPNSSGAPSFGYELIMYNRNGTTQIAYGSAYYDVDYFAGLIRFDPGKTPIDTALSSGLGFQFNQSAFESLAVNDATRKAYIQSSSTGGPRVVAWQYVGQRLSNYSFSGGGSVSFDNSDTIGFTQSGPTYSFFINQGSITASLLNTGISGGATAGYFLSVDSSGNFVWSQSASGTSGTSGTSGVTTQLELYNTETINFVTQSTIYGLSASAFIATASVSTMLLATGSNGGATAGYVLSNTGDGNFAWVPQSAGGTSLTVSDYQTGSTFSNVQNIIFRGGLVSTPTGGGTAMGVLATGPTPTVTVWIPAPPAAVYASHFNLTDGNTNGTVVRSLSPVASVRISNPTSEGVPFETNGWAGTINAATTATTPVISTSGLVTGFSGTSSGNSTVTVTVFRADGTTPFTTYTTPVLYQNGVHTNGAGVTVTISGYSLDDSGFPAIYTTKYKASISVSVNMGTIFGANLLDGGRYKIRVQHYTDILTDGGATYSATTSDVFYDTNLSTPTISGTTTLIESTNPSNILTKHISGVEYYISGSQFEITTTGIDNLNQNTQGFSSGVTKNFTINAPNHNLPTYNLQAWSPTVGTFQGWSNIYTLTGVTFSYTSWAISNSSSYRFRGNAAPANAQAFDPWGSSSLSLSATSSILIDQVSDNSTRLGESFNGETERLVRGSSTFSAWDSTATLGTTISNQTGTGPFCDACIVGGYLVRPDKYWLSSGLANLQPNLTTFKPDKNGTNPDYSSHTQIATYHRRFYTASSKNIPSFIMTFSGNWPGSYPDASSALAASQLKIYIRRISSPTGNFGPTANPLSMHGGLYNSGSFDDNGATDSAATAIRTGVGANNNIINATFGGKPANVGFWMELQIVNPDIKLDFINVTLTFADSTTDSAPVT